MSDVLLLAGCILGCGLAVGIVAAVLFGRHERRRPYLAARWDETAADWADETRHDISPADLDALELLWDLPAYGTGDHTTTNPTGDQTP